MNKVILIGHLGKDPEVKYFESGTAVAQFSLATTERGYTTTDGKQVPDRTDWHNIVLWRKMAEIAEKWLHKGDKILIEGSIRTRSYDDQQGIKRSIVEIYADRMEMLSTKKDTSKPLPPEEPQRASSQPASQAQQPAQMAAAPQAPQSELPFAPPYSDSFYDSLP